MAQQFIVAKGGAIVLPGGALLEAGSIFTQGEPIRLQGNSYPPLTSPQIEEHLRSGYLQLYGIKDEPITASDLTDSPPGKVETPPLPGPGKDGIDPKEAVMSINTGGVEVSSKPTAPPVVQEQSPWNLDAETLQGKDVDELNVMILERDENGPEFETKEEAMAFLSQDFAAPSQSSDRPSKKKKKN